MPSHTRTRRLTGRLTGGRTRGLPGGRTLAAATLLAVAGLGAASPALAVDAKDNAALAYWRTFALVGPNAAAVISGVDRSAIGAEEFTIDDPAVLEIIRNDLFVGRLIDAAGRPDCDFAVEHERGFEALLPHLGPMRTASVVLILRARLDLAEGHTAHAVAALEAALRSAEHILDDRTLISSLVGAAIVGAAQPVLGFAAAHGGLIALFTQAVTPPSRGEHPAPGDHLAGGGGAGVGNPRSTGAPAATPIDPAAATLATLTRLNPDAADLDALVLSRADCVAWTRAVNPLGP